MKTVIIKKIDGFDIITGFGNLTIDAVETKKTMKPIVEKTDEKKAVENKQKELQKIYSNRSDLVRIAKQHYKNKDISKQAKAEYDIQLRDEQIKILKEEFKVLHKVLHLKGIEIWNENLVYFEPKKGEIVIDDEKYISLMKLFKDNPKGFVFTLDEEKIIDNRGVKYVKNGKVLTVEKLDESPDGPLQKDVTPEQFEIMRLESLTAEEKQKEIDLYIDGLAGQAAFMKSKLEIQGDNSALSKSQDWYKVEVLKIEEKYK